MSHRWCVALSALVLTLACSSSKPPESSTPEAAAQEPEAEPAAPGSPSVQDPAAPEAPSSAPVVETLFVRDQRVACEAEGPRECLQVRRSESDAWRNLYSPIEGFEYEPGYLYELELEVSRVVNPPQDASALKYRLLKVVSKRKASP
jgi:uncharacterized protein DUF4377